MTMILEILCAGKFKLSMRKEDNLSTYVSEIFTEQVGVLECSIQRTKTHAGLSCTVQDHTYCSIEIINSATSSVKWYWFLQYRIWSPNLPIPCLHPKANTIDQKIYNCLSKMLTWYFNFRKVHKFPDGRNLRDGLD